MFVPVYFIITHIVIYVISTERNLIEAASNGASQSIKLVANIAVNLIAFIALLHLINSVLTWFGHRLGWYDDPLTFEVSKSISTF